MKNEAAAPRTRSGKTDLKVGYACNNRCVHCVIADQRDGASARRGSTERTTREIVAEMVDARSKGHRILVLTGGEPTLRRDLTAILAAARELGFSLHVQTNGRRFADKAFAERLASFKITCVVALHGDRADVHDAVTRAPGSFDQTVDGIRNLLATDQRVFVKVVLSRLNAGHVTAIVALAADLGVRLVNVAFPHALGEARRRFDQVVPRYAEVMPDLLSALEAYGDRLDLGVEAIPFCLLPGYESHVTDQPFRDSCVAIEHRQLDDPAARDWREARAEMKGKPDSCRACRFDARCQGVWREYLDHFGGDELVPVVSPVSPTDMESTP